MVIQRKVSKETYLIAGIITLLIFLLGVLLGFLIDTMRAESSEQKSKEQEVNYNSLQIQYLLLDDLTQRKDACPVLNIALQDSIKALSKSLNEFQEYKKNSHLSMERFSLIHRKYILDNLRYWQLATKAKSVCNINILPILYFYSSDYCDICPNQGTTLTYYKKKFGDVIPIFPIDVDMAQEESTIQILQAKYNITTYPSLVVDQTKYEGIQDKATLGAIICSKLTSNELC